MDLIQEQGTLAVGSEISQTEFALASTIAVEAAARDVVVFSLLLLLLLLLLPVPVDDVDEEEVDDAFEEGSFGSVLGTMPPDSPITEFGDCCGVGSGGVARMMQSCQARSGKITAGEWLISADDILFWLPRSFEGDSGTVSGGFMSGLPSRVTSRALELLLMLLLVLLLPLLLPLPFPSSGLRSRSAPVPASELATATVREDAA